jgi:SAM-dependent methyltransferase
MTPLSQSVGQAFGDGFAPGDQASRRTAVEQDAEIGAPGAPAAGLKPIDVLRRLMRTSPFQPATNFWRVIELDMVRRHGLPRGVGLDLGCGDGKLTAILDEMCGDAADRTWVGVDIDPDETALARSMGLYARVHTGSADRIDEPDESFDFAFSNSVLEHVEPIQAVLREASRVLKRGGRFIATVPGPGFHACLAGGGASPAGRAAYLRETDARCAHLRYWSQAEWRAELAAAGLELATARPYLTERQVRRWETLATWTGGLAYRVFGKTRRPIEVQRLFRMRREEPGLAGALGDQLAPLLGLGCSIAGDDAPGKAGCLLVEAVKP